MGQPWAVICPRGGEANLRRTRAARSDNAYSVDPGNPFIVTIVLGPDSAVPQSFGHRATYFPDIGVTVPARCLSQIRKMPSIGKCIEVPMDLFSYILVLISVVYALAGTKYSKARVDSFSLHPAYGHFYRIHCGSSFYSSISSSSGGPVGNSESSTGRSPNTPTSLLRRRCSTWPAHWCCLRKLRVTKSIWSDTFFASAAYFLELTFSRRSLHSSMETSSPNNYG